MMNQATLARVADEAQRFIELANALHVSLETERRSRVVTGTRLSGAVRRASMDLTRALADLRRSW